ncbi:hypothetical protein [Rheinheimera sp.]|uniref:hypothetical protein n=1 Tax=Rheinheimera sp. TaxID=1869214 RepID=UPI0040484631
MEKKPIFSESSIQALRNLGVDSNEFESTIYSEFPLSVDLFEEVVSKFRDKELCTYLGDEFHLHMKQYPDIDSNSLLYNKLYDLYNYFRQYDAGGVFFLFKNRQAEWGGPRVTLTENDVPRSDLNTLPDFFIIYRGMSLKESVSSCFGQSWTLDIDVARKFAFEYYSDENRGVVASGLISRESVIHYEHDDEEQEVVIRAGAVKRIKVNEI